MTRQEATKKALETYARTGRTQLVILRTDHPHVSGDYFYAIAETGKYAWTPGETLVERIRR